MRNTDVEISLCFDKIMTSEVLFYSLAFDEDCRKFCTKREITYLPSETNSKLCYTLINDKFDENVIEDSQKVNIKDHIFDNSVVEKFEKHHVLFAYRDNDVAGVIHFSDYNRPLVFVKIYVLLLEFEKKIRKLLISRKFTNRDMVEFFKNHSENPHYEGKFKKYQKPSKQNEMKKVEKFQTFNLKDLIGLVTSKKIAKIPESINDLRKAIMHGKNVVKYKNSHESTLIYEFESFKEFFKSINSLKSEIKKVANLILPTNEGEEVTRLRNADLFKKITFKYNKTA